jgi:cation diffusion facilitator CzcD-associated flavoprotein CzcO
VTRHYQVAVIGTGFAGLGMACELKRRAIDDFVVFERADDVGGTWRDNTYPGCACDIRSDLYSFSFAPNPNWTHRYARQPEILDYLRKTTAAWRLTEHIRFGHEVQNASWDESSARWNIRTNRGPFTARILIAGHGPLIRPKWPDIAGVDEFAGDRFHSAQWDHEVDLTGKRVAVMGTGASAIQFIPQIQPVAGRLTVFQRTPPWVVPGGDRPTSARRRAMLRRFPVLQRGSRALIFRRNELTFAVFAHDRVGRLLEWVGRRHIAAQIADPALREKLTPTYRIGCKRILLSDDYYPALSQSNVELVTDPITEITGGGVATADGRHRSVDVLIAGTGYNATNPPIAHVVHGRDGGSLAHSWRTHMEALHGTTVANFPNFFLLVGPNTGLGHNSIVYMIEAQIRYIMLAIDHLRSSDATTIEPLALAQRAYNDALQSALRESVWVRGGCTSFYLDAGGRNSTLWPYRATRFRRALSTFDPDHYETRRADAWAREWVDADA